MLSPPNANFTFPSWSQAARPLLQCNFGPVVGVDVVVSPVCLPRLTGECDWTHFMSEVLSTAVLQ
eukprot:2331717-Amphidinium_carterae.3